jgi:uncharacterized membrane protein YcgQ (UPF0703/DUF1980 family)
LDGKFNYREDSKMRNTKILLITVLVIALSGCQSKAPVNQNAKNGNGTPALNTAQNSTPTPAPSAPAVSAAGDPADEAADDAEAVDMAKSGDVVEIKEKMFVAQTNDIYYNVEDYLGKTIKYEGVFSAYTWEETGATYYSVFRYGPGCCGVDANCGFEVVWDKQYPAPDDWVEAVGILEEYDEDGYQYLRLALTSLTVLATRGADYVTQ